jgi:hypothetical protein
LAGTFAKAGSVLVNAVVREMTAAAGIGLMDWPTLWYERGIDTAAFQVDLAAAFPS